MNVSVAIVIPVYRAFEKCSGNEIIALEQALEVFKTRDIILAGPHGLNINGYAELFGRYGRKPIFVGLAKEYFGSVGSYNTLCLSKEFYQPFLAYSHLLIYQTDAFAFTDSLDEWCRTEYDYIGAPWCEGWTNPTLPLKFTGVGNGGFSLRRVASFFKITSNTSDRKLKKIKRGNAIVHIYWTTSFLRKIPGLWRIIRRFNTVENQEDHFWGSEATKIYRWFTVAPPEVALRFSFEVAPEEMYKLNNYTLPFGCHAWEKFGVEFWKKFIPSRREMISTE